MSALKALVEQREDGVAMLLAPAVGMFELLTSKGAVVQAGDRIGRLRRLDKSFDVTVPVGTGGQVHLTTAAPYGTVHPLAYRQEMFELRSGEHSVTEAVASQDSDDLVICAPIDGIFYARPAPDQPPFVQVGERVSAGQALGLIEVMKTFHPIECPESMQGAVVEALPAGDGSEVAADSVLLRLRRKG